MGEEKIQTPLLKIASIIALTLLTIATLLLGIFPFQTWNLALEVADTLLLASQLKFQSN